MWQNILPGFSMASFLGHLIFIRGDILWGYVKFQVHKCCPRNLEVLKEAIITEIQCISQKILEKVIQNF